MYYGAVFAYLLGSALGAHPYPTTVRDSHRVIAEEARAQILKAEGKLSTAIIVGGGSNAIGAFYEFLNDRGVQLIGVEAGGRGHSLGEHAARFTSEGGGSPGHRTRARLAARSRPRRIRLCRRPRSPPPARYRLVQRAAGH